MKKMRKIFAVLLTLAMVLAMSMTTFAAKTGATLTVKGLATNGDQKLIFMKFIDWMMMIIIGFLLVGQRHWSYYKKYN